MGLVPRRYGEDGDRVMSRPANPDTTALHEPRPKIFNGTRASVERRNLTDPAVVAALVEEIALTEEPWLTRRLTVLPIDELRAIVRFAFAAMPASHFATELVELSDRDAPRAEIADALAAVCEAARNFLGRFNP